MKTNKMQTEHIKYSEGQWFAIPLNNGGYALGIIVRGSYKTKGGLGYFFGPRYEDIPDGNETWHKKPSDAILMAWFGDLGIITGRWPLISTTRSFNRHEWSVPGFRSIDPVYPAKGWLIEYNTQSNKMEMIRRTYRDAVELPGLP
ncbi:immunity protein 14 [Anaerolinea thermolimosa]|uniref:Immunity protein 14 n=1 Tax=Anaerolinea thermolimosa TaxID=229919 RepID=A0A7U9PXL5_9CHLR|nr:immunity 26/phosphotriesterase HocA family protein [Anaerolinea thermolimosa]GAP08819.1 immunity protein 14 [Anaerolinea thermolimosa]GAP08869.1 immunity protein 14 [Anaerolinea thermolimosa]